MWVEFSVPENQLLRFRAPQRRGLVREPEGDFEVEVVLADGTVYPHRGRITFADASFSEATGTFLLRAEIANTDQTRHPGQFVRARLQGAVRPIGLLIPQRAVQQGAKGRFVWVVNLKRAAPSYVRSPRATGMATSGSWTRGYEGAAHQR